MHISKNTRGHITIIAILTAAFFLGGFCLPHNPSTWFDEGIYLQIGQNLSRLGEYGIQTSPGIFEPMTLISVGYPVHVPVAIVFSLFGVGLLQARMVALAYIIGLVCASYLLIKRMHGDRAALFGSLLLMSFAPLYGNGRNVLGEVPGLFFFVAGLLAFSMWKEDTSSSRPAFFSGLLFGLAIAAKPHFLVLLPALATAILLNKKIFSKNRHALSIALLAGLIPVAAWIFSQFPSIGVLGEVWAHYTNPFVQDNISSSIFLNLKRFVTESTPIHFAILAILLLASILIRAKNKKKLEPTEVVLYVTIGLTWFAFLRTSGWYRQLFIPHALILLTAYPSLVDIQSYFSKKLHRVFPLLAVLALLAVQSVHFITTALWCEVSDAELGATQLNVVLPDMGTDILFFNVPELVPLTHFTNYSQYLKINPRIIFGEKNRLTEEGIPLFVVTRDVEPESDILSTCYTQIQDLGRYTLFQNIRCGL